VESFGIFVQGIKLPAEGLVHISALNDDHYRFDRTTHTLAGSRAGNIYRLGDLLRVSVARVDLDRRELDFRVLRHVSRPAPRRKAVATAPGKPAAKGKSKGPATKKKAGKKTFKRTKRR
jgi:ribonuclease R